MSDESKKCSSCGSPMKDGEKFCPNCGKQAGMTCRHCGSEISSTEKFCHSCGKPTTEEPKPVKKEHGKSKVIQNHSQPEKRCMEKKKISIVDYPHNFYIGNHKLYT